MLAGAAHVIAIDTVADRLEMARRFGAQAVHLTEEDPRAAVKDATAGRGVDVAVDAVGDPRALELAIRLARKCGTVSVVGVYAERCEVHMGLAWIKALTIRTGHANVIRHLDPVLELLAAGKLDPGAAGHASHGARTGTGGLRAVRRARGAEDRAVAVSARCRATRRVRPSR